MTFYNNNQTQKTFSIAVNSIVRKQPQSNAKHKCTGQCGNCANCSSHESKKTENV
jgi:hypothetical protein